MKLARQADRPRHVPECLPDDCVDIEWTPLAKVRAEVRNYNANEVARMWSRWRKAQDSVNADWLAAQNERVADLALIVDRDRQKTLLEEEETKRREFLSADHAENEKWAALLTAAQHRANKAEAKRLRRDIERFNATIRAGLKRKFGRT